MPEPQFISLIRLIQAPEKYHEKRVRVVGYAGLEFEHKAVYVSVDDRKNAVTKNAIWLDVELTEKVSRLDKKYVIVEGVFDMESLGHLKLFSGTVTEVDRLEVWSEPAQP